MKPVSRRYRVALDLSLFSTSPISMQKASISRHRQEKAAGRVVSKRVIEEGNDLQPLHLGLREHTITTLHLGPRYLRKKPMSLIWSLKKLIDPIQARKEEAGHQEHLVMPGQQESGDKISYQCKACGLIDERGDYCPQCLAQTMEPVK